MEYVYGCFGRKGNDRVYVLFYCDNWHDRVGELLSPTKPMMLIVIPVLHIIIVWWLFKDM